MRFLEFNEKKHHGSIGFPVEFYHVDERHPRYLMPFHWHSEVEFIYVTEGRFLLYLEGEVVEAGTGDILFVNDGIVHGGVPEECVYECVVLDLKAMFAGLEPCKPFISRITRHAVRISNRFSREDTDVRAAVLRLFAAMRGEGAGREFIAAGALYEVFGLILQNRLYTDSGAGDGHSGGRIARLKQVLEYIESSYQAEISLEEMARVAGMSLKYFCRYFHSVTHKTPMVYVNYYRVERACYLLSSSDISVTEAAYACGFNDSSYFIKTFKRFKNITPKQYSLRFG